MVGTYRGDLGRSGFYPSENGVTAANIATLKLHWTATGGTGSFAQPIVGNNMVYWGDWNGVEHGTDLTGTDQWTANLGQNVASGCSPSVAGVSGSATLGVMGGTPSTPVAYVPGGDGNLYALNALNGTQIWKTNLGTPPAVYLWASPILYNGSIYEGVSSFGDCPLIRGSLVQMDAVTGAIQHIAYMDPPGCIGSSIWGSPTIDASDNSVYVATGNPNGCSTGSELGPSIVKLSASDLTILSSWTVPQSAQSYGDADFGNTPTLFTATINGVARSLVAALNKNGIEYAWDRTNLAAGPVWQATIGDPSGSPRNIVSAAWDGTRLYVGGGGAIINGTSCYGNLGALDPATGAFLWRACIPGFMNGAITVVPGLLLEGSGAVGKLNILDTATGTILRVFSMPARSDGEVTVSNGIIYASLSNGNLIAIGQ
jgi:polyvinyl alcohol dehydrogenase (cytochrome)